MKLIPFLLLFILIFEVSAGNLIVFLKDSENMSGFVMNSDFSNRPELIRKLKRNFNQSQQNFMMNLNTLRQVKQGAVLWSLNAVSLECPDELEHQIQQLPAVRMVLPDLMEMPETTVRSESRETDGSGNTYGIKLLSVPGVWEELKINGSGVTVGVIDTGIDGKHPEFQGKIIRYMDTSGSVEPTDSHGHGTHVCGTICGGNLSGMNIGVAPGSRLLVAKGISSKGGRASGLLESMQWMIDPDGNPDTSDFPRVVSCSWTSGYTDQNPYYEMIERWISLGIVPNFSAGNSGPSASTITAPKEHPGSFAAGAFDQNSKIAQFSSRGPGNYKGIKTPKPDWSAPGVDVYSVKPGGGYVKMSGTSMAAPHVAGIIALMLQARPELTVAEIRDILTECCEDSGESGYDYVYGHGCLNAYKAVKLVLSSGKVQGKVTGISGNLKPSVRVLETGKSVICSAQGDFRLMLPAGTYTLEFSCTGFETLQKQITVTQNCLIELEIRLKEAKKIIVSGQVKAKDTSEPLQASVLIKETGNTSVCDSKGRYSLTISAGKYTIVTSCTGYRSYICETQFFDDQFVTVELERVPEVLLVDDDCGKNYENYYKASLDSMNIEFDYVNLKEKGNLSDEEIIPYQLLIWFTGDDSSGTLSSSDITALTKYLVSGGHLILTGQDIGYNLKNNAFYRDVLKSKYISDSAKDKSVSGTELNFVLGDDSAGNQRYPDVISPLEGAKELFSYGSGSGCAAVKTDQVVYLGFGFEGISGTDSRLTVMKKLTDMMIPGWNEKIDRCYRIAALKGLSQLEKAMLLEAYEASLAEKISDISSEQKEEIINLLKDRTEMLLLKEALRNYTKAF